MNRGKIRFVSLDLATGHEQSGKRPIPIVSKVSFSKLIRLPVAAPVISGGNFTRTTGFTASLEKAGTKTAGVIRCGQSGTIDMATRNGKRLECILDATVSEMLARLDAILS